MALSLSGVARRWGRQHVIDADEVPSTTPSDGEATGGWLQGESQANALGSEIRSTDCSPVSAFSGAVGDLEEIGLSTNGNDNSISLSDSSKLDEVSADNLTELKQLFTDSTHEIAVKLSSFVDTSINDGGTFLARSSIRDGQSGDIDSQIESMERLIQFRRQQMIDGFVAMEMAQTQINQRLAFRNQHIGHASLIPS